MAKKTIYKIVEYKNGIYNLINKNNLSKIIIKEENFENYIKENNIKIEQK